MRWETDLGMLFLLLRYTISGPINPSDCWPTCGFDPGPVVDIHSTLMTGTGTWVFAMEDPDPKRLRHCQLVTSVDVGFYYLQ